MKGFWQTIAIVVCVVLVHFAHAASQILSSQLEFIPYSSTYLPLRYGYLTSHVKIPFEFEKFINPKIISHWKETSTMSRFDEARSEVLGVQKTLSPLVSKKYYEFGADLSVGFCHQWSAAALHPDIYQRLSASDGIICNNTLITQGELKELFTAFYHVPTAPFFGNITKESESDVMYNIRKKLGMDDLFASTFHTTLHHYLAQDQGVVIDLKPLFENSNHPVYRVTSSIELENPYKFIKQLPPVVFETDDLSFKEVLSKITKLDDILQRAIFREISDEEVRDAWKPYGSSFKEFFYDSLWMIGDLLEIRQKYMDSILKGLEKKNVSLKNGILIKKITTHITYAQYNDQYALANNQSKTSVFEYILIESNSRNIGSVWLTPPEKRPDFL